jgi:tRNA (guanine-N7-)-methyltransferase
LGHKRGTAAGKTVGAPGTEIHAKWETGEVLLPESLALSTAAGSQAVVPSPPPEGGASPGGRGVIGRLSPGSAPKLDLKAIFGNARPVEVEIGTGKGTFLLARATARPEVNFLGIEWARAYAIYAADRFRRAGLTNVRMIRCDASHLFKLCLGDRCLWRVHIYFPDPWPKRKHHHRRLIQRAFVEEVRRVLKPGGQFVIVTDHQEYFRHIEGVVTQVAGLAAAPMPRMSDRAGEVVGTNFERKYIAQGRPFYKLARIRYV